MRPDARLKLLKIKIVYHLHGKGIKGKSKSRFINFLYRFAFRKSDIICLSPLLVNDIEDVFNGNIHIVNNGIPDILNRKSTENGNRSFGKKVSILFLSNLLRSKGLLDFLEAIKILSVKSIDFGAVIVGAESEYDSRFLSEYFKENGLEQKISFLGPKYGSEKEEVFSMCDILVFPTLNDVWGNVILEAMQCGKPVIATYEGAIPEIIDNEVTGYLVAKNSPRQIADKLELLIIDQTLRESFGYAGRKKYEEKFTRNTFEKNMDLVFHRILSDNTEL